MKKVSVYVKGDRNSTAYYRIYQYLDKISEIKCEYRMMMSSHIHSKYMPVSKCSIVIKFYVYIHVYFRMLYALFYDNIKKPDIVVIHRRIISRFMPFSYKCLLLLLKYRGVKIVWDFDDNIVESGEVSKTTFDFYSKLSDTIVVTHVFLKEQISCKVRNKVQIIPTTDGDMYKSFKDDKINSYRLLSLEKELNLVWVATSSNLEYLNGIINILDLTAKKIKKNGLNLKLLVVCDSPLLHNCQNLKVCNIKWTRNKAIETMKIAHIGLMPLANTSFTMGKGGFKLVQYMSIGLPSIGSNVGYNTYVLSDEAGVLVNGEQDWEDAIIKLSDKDIWNQYSQNAYNRWVKAFSYNENLNRWKQILLYNQL